MAKLLPVTLLTTYTETVCNLLYQNHISNIDSEDPFLYLAFVEHDKVKEYEFYYRSPNDESCDYHMALQEAHANDILDKLNLSETVRAVILIVEEDKSILVSVYDKENKVTIANLKFRKIRYNERKLRQSERENFDLSPKEVKCESGITSSYAWDEAQGRLNLFLCSLNNVAKALRKSYDLPKIAEVEIRFKNGLIITTDKLKKK